MNEVVSFKKEIDFNTMIDKIMSIGIEHTLMSDGNSNIKGDLIVSGTYRETEASQVDSPFSYKIPVDIVVDSKYDITNMTIDIDDFTYDIIDNKLVIDVSLMLNNLEMKKNDNIDDEIINIDDLFLEKDNKSELSIEVENNNKESKVENIEKSKEKENIAEDNLSDSLFSNLDSVNETYKTYSVYIFRENDSLDEIIEKYKISREKLEEYNDLNNIKKGSKIIIPNYE